jgi:hypothetical protein
MEQESTGKIRSFFSTMQQLFKKPTKNTRIAISTNSIVLVLAIFAPLLYNVPLCNGWISSINSGYNDDQKYSLFVSVVWLFAVNISSLCSLTVVNKDASTQKQQIAGDAMLPDSCEEEAIRLDRNLDRIWRFTECILIILVCVIVSLLFHPTEEFIHLGALFSSAVYMGLVSINDCFGHLCLDRCLRIKHVAEQQFQTLSLERVDTSKISNSAVRIMIEETIRGRKRFLNKIEELEHDLSFFSRMIVFIDIPIIIGLGIIYAQEYLVLRHGLFRSGFSIGAIAMHIIAANLISIMIGMYIFDKKQDLPTT